MSAARTPGARFRVVRHPDLRVLRFDDESVVFNPVLWQTHLLNASAALIFDCLEESPATAAELAAELAGEGADAGVPLEQIEQALGDLAGLGLVEPDAVT